MLLANLKTRQKMLLANLNPRLQFQTSLLRLRCRRKTVQLGLKLCGFRPGHFPDLNQKPIRSLAQPLSQTKQKILLLLLDLLNPLLIKLLDFLMVLVRVSSNGGQLKPSPNPKQINSPNKPSFQKILVNWGKWRVLALLLDA